MYKINNLSLFNYFLSLLIFTLLLISCNKQDSSAGPSCEDTNCSNYTSQADAQAAFNLDPECRADLDADKDGIACEENGNMPTICPTTPNCGCSGINKSACQTNPCCRWIVGDGCKCK